jgi:hypothetical protein
MLATISLASSQFLAGTDSSAFLSLAVCTQLVHSLDNWILHQLHTIRNAESRTGHGKLMRIVSELTMADITKLSEDMSRCVTVLANIHRHLLISKAVISHTTKMLETSPVETMPGSHQSLCQRKKELVMDAISTLDTQVIWNESYATYLLERAKSQISVV